MSWKRNDYFLISKQGHLIYWVVWGRKGKKICWDVNLWPQNLKAGTVPQDLGNIYSISSMFRTITPKHQPAAATYLFLNLIRFPGNHIFSWCKNDFVIYFIFHSILTVEQTARQKRAAWTRKTWFGLEKIRKSATIWQTTHAYRST